MVGTVEYVGMNAQYRESAEDTGLGRLFDTFADRRDILLRDRAAHNGRLELEGLLAVGIHGLEVYFTVSILSASAGLSRVLAVHVDCLGDGLFISNLRSAYVGLYLKLTKETVNDDLKMQLAHTGDDGLSRFLVRMNAEGRILFGKLG